MDNFRTETRDEAWLADRRDDFIYTYSGIELDNLTLERMGSSHHLYGPLVNVFVKRSKCSSPYQMNEWCCLAVRARGLGRCHLRPSVETGIKQ
jgi:hypothetical protein